MTTKCNPPCTPNVATGIGVVPDPVPPAPAPTTPVDYDVCGGIASLDVAGAYQVAFAPGQVVFTKACPGDTEFDTVTLCDPTTGVPVLVVTTYSAAGVPTATAYNPDGTAYPGAISTLVACGSNSESDAEEMCDNGTTTFLRWFVKKNGEPTGTVFDTTTAGAPYVPVGPVTRGACGASCTWETEHGYLADPSSVSLLAADKCNVTEVILGGNTYAVSLAPFWTTADFVAALNAAAGSTLLTIAANGDVVAGAEAVTNMQVVCAEPDFTEPFGTNAGAKVIYDLAGAATQPGASTSYAFVDDGGALLAENTYCFARVRDLRAGIFDMGNGAAGVDASGNPDGLVMAVNGAAAPGEFYRQVATGLIVGQEYEFSVYIADGNGSTFSHPNVSLIIDQGPATAIQARVNTGTLNYLHTWKRWSVKFVAKTTSVQYAAINNSAAAGGNDVLLDRVAFSRVSRQDFIFIPRRRLFDVEIVKRICSDGSITVRALNAAGTVEYTIPDPSGMILHIGSPNVPATASNTAIGHEIDQYEVSDSFCVTDAGVSTPWIRRTIVTFDNASGEEKSRDVSWTDGAAVQPGPPAGVAVLGACQGKTSAISYEARCWCFTRAAGTTTETFTVGLDPAGRVVTIVDRDAASTVIVGDPDGAPIIVDLAMWQAWDPTITAATLTSCCGSGSTTPAIKTYATTVQDVAAGAVLNVAPLGNLVSWTVRNRSSTTGTISVNGGAALPLDTAETLSSGIMEGSSNYLADTLVVTAGNGIVRVTTVRRQ